MFGFEYFGREFDSVEAGFTQKKLPLLGASSKMYNVIYDADDKYSQELRGDYGVALCAILMRKTKKGSNGIQRLSWRCKRS